MSSRHFRQGFTLIEMLVVLVVMSLFIGLTMPKLWGTYNKRVEQGQLEGVVSAIAALRVEYRRIGEPLILESKDFVKNDTSKLSLPEDWKILRMQQLRFLVNGVTNGGEIELEAGSGRQWKIWYQPLDGKVTTGRIHETR